mmetsp:Transcript_26972/g.45218  ORF Transcript_26972/g.45218 Transcript_26972/m.45218 type:complete len:252 (+) Transcript_26972:315-1070(+)
MDQRPMDQSSERPRVVPASTSGRPPPARPPRFVRPGVLAQLVKASKVQKSVKSTITAVGNKRMRFSPHAFDEQMLNKANQMYAKTLASIFAKDKRRHGGTTECRQKSPQNTLLELPNDLLMRIVCQLHHDELKPLLRTCSRLRHAALAAIVVYFNYNTPEPCRALGLESTISMTSRLRSPPRDFRAAAIKAIAGGPRAPRRCRRRYAPSVSPPPAARAKSTAASAEDQSTTNDQLEARTLPFTKVTSPLCA